MYTPEQVKWWAERSQSPAHQEAYDFITSHVVPRGDITIVDYCCGTGEMIKRIGSKSKRGAQPLIIGVDSSQEMINASENNLKSAGIDCLVLENPEQLANQRGIVLIREDIADSQLPQGVADISLLTFPELHIKVTPTLEEDILAKCPFNSESELKYLVPNYALSKITKRGGHVIIVDYDTFRDDIKRDNLRQKIEEEWAQAFSLEVLKSVFRPSLNIYSDIEEERRKNRGDIGKKGYRVITYRKI